MSLQIPWSISAQWFGSLWSLPNPSPIQREKQGPEKHQVLTSSHSPLVAEPQRKLNLQPLLPHSARRLPARCSRGSGKHQHAVSMKSFPLWKSPEMTGGLYDSACAVKHGEIMSFCLLVGLFWFGLVFEKKRSQDTWHQCVEVLGLCWGSPSVMWGKGCSALDWGGRWGRRGQVWVCAKRRRASPGGLWQ